MHLTGMACVCLDFHKIEAYNEGVGSFYIFEKGGFTMAVSARVDSLKEKHAHLEYRLERELQRPSPDQDAVRDLKRQKLFLKDEIQRMVTH